MKRLKYWFISVALVPLITIFGSDLGIPSWAVQILLFALLSGPFLNYFINQGYSLKMGGESLFFVYSMIFVIFNIVLSLDPFVSLVYWITYIFFIVGIRIWIKTINVTGGNQLNDFVKTKLGYFILGSLILMYIGIFLLGLASAKTYNAFGIISGSALAFFWFHKSKQILKISIISVLLYFVFISLSRSSLLIVFAVILLMEILFSKNKLGTIVLCLTVFISLNFFSESILNWIAQKDNDVQLSSFSDLGKINDRSVLVDNFFRIYQNNFFLGYGINTDYYNLPEWDIVGNIGVHNGILDMILTVGVPLSLFIGFLVFVSVKNLWRLLLIDPSYKAVFAFVLYCVVRSYGESYFVLNIGNVMSLLFIFVLIYFFNKKKLISGQSQ